MGKASMIITRWFIKKNVLPSEDENLYIYAINCLMITVSPLVLVLVIGARMNLVAEGVFIIIPFMIIRTFSGGIHSESSRRCFVISTGILLFLLVMTRVISNSYVLGIVMVGGSISLIVCSPIESENKPLSIYEKKAYKRKTCVWVSIFATIYFILGLLEQHSYAVCIALGIILTAALQIPCQKQKHR